MMRGPGPQIFFPRTATANLAHTFKGSIQTKAHGKFGRKGSVGISRDYPNFFQYPVLPQEWVKMQKCTHGLI